MKLFKKHLFIFIALAIFQVHALEQFEPPYTVLVKDISYEVNTDGTFTREEDFSIRINNQEGMGLAQYPIAFNQSLQTVEVLEAYTETKTGARTDVEPKDMFTRAISIVQGAPVFGDIQAKVVVFPAVEVGSTISMRFRIEQTNPHFAGEFYMLEAFPLITEFKSGTVSLSAPKEMALNFEAIDLEGGEVKSDEAGKTAWRWEVAATPALAPEPGAVSPVDASPRVAMSSFSNYGAVSQAYLENAKPKAQATDKIRKQADKITRGITSRKEQAEAIYRWVSSKVRHVNIITGLGGFVPHDAEDILKTRYGDCKDHDTLLQALLEAKGIESHPVLVDAATQYWIPKVAGPYFNHVITYIPEFDLYLDTTPAAAPFGVLSPLISGKTALLTNPRPGRAQLVQLPSEQLRQKNTEYVTTIAEITETGEILLTRTIDTTGTNELASRAFLKKIPRGQEKQLVSVMLSQTGQSGRGAIERNKPEDLTEPSRYTFHLIITGKLTNDSGQINFPIGIPSQQGAEQFIAFSAQSHDNFDYICQSSNMSHDMTVALPENLTLENLPEGKAVKSDYGFYQSAYEYSDNTLTIRRSLDLDMPGLCDHNDQKALIAWAGEIAADSRAPIDYRWQ